MALGPIVVARRSRRIVGPERGAEAGRPRGEFVALYLPLDGAQAGGDAYVVDGVAPPPALAQRECLALLAPHRFLAPVLPAGRPPGRLPRSVMLRVLQAYLDGLLSLELDGRQGDLAAEAVRSLLGGAFLAAGMEQGLGARRRMSLLEQAVAHVDAHLNAPLAADGLCDALGCSRSALYRATAPAGGVAELIVQRRLAAIRERLRDPGERRPIAEIAEAHGLPDAAQFSRRFKAAFGATPGEERRFASAAAARPLSRPRPQSLLSRRVARSRPCR